MKTWMLLLLAALLSVSALAEDAAVVPTAESIEAIAFVEDEAGYDGVWVPFEDGFKLYLPSAWRSYDLTDEQAAAGLFYRAGNGDGAADGGVAMGVAVGYMSVCDIDGIDGLAAYFGGTGLAGVRRVQLNGIPAVLFASAADGFSGAAFIHPTLPEYALLVYVTPIGEAADGILMSVSLRDDGDESGE